VTEGFKLERSGLGAGSAKGVEQRLPDTGVDGFDVLLTESTAEVDDDPPLLQRAGSG
jgi:hypothetical protein